MALLLRSYLYSGDSLFYLLFLCFWGWYVNLSSGRGVGSILSNRGEGEKELRGETGAQRNQTYGRTLKKWRPLRAKKKLPSFTSRPFHYVRSCVCSSCEPPKNILIHFYAPGPGTLPPQNQPCVHPYVGRPFNYPSWSRRPLWVAAASLTAAAAADRPVSWGARLRI